MKKVLSLVLCAALLICTFCFTALANDGTQNVWTITKATMYSQPDANSAVVQYVPANENVVSYQKYRNGFTETFYGDKFGWIATSLLSTTKQGNNGGGGQNNLNGNWGANKVLSQRTYLYSAPTTNTSIYATLEANTPVLVHTVTDGWANVTVGNMNGYIPTCFIQGWNTEANKPPYSTTWYAGYDWSNVYNYQYYMNANPDVVAALGTDPNAIISHYINIGVNEGRQGSPSFVMKNYVNNNPHLYAKTQGIPLNYLKEACGIPY